MHVTGLPPAAKRASMAERLSVLTRLLRAQSSGVLGKEPSSKPSEWGT